jgi:hypothetical protein
LEKVSQGFATLRTRLVNQGRERVRARERDVERDSDRDIEK